MRAAHRHPNESVDAVTGHTDRIATRVGLALYEERRRRRLSLATVAIKAGVSVSTLHAIENGARASVRMYVRLAKALDRDLEVGIVDPKRRDEQRHDVDIVHAAMGEAEASVLIRHGTPVRIDQPWQHYHFAGRADVLAWDVERSTLLHIENRTRFPDLQDAIGRFNTKREYLSRSLWQALGFPRQPRPEVHAMVALWSSEVIRVVRRNPSTFRSISEDAPECLAAWLSGTPPVGHSAVTFVLFDPLATGRSQRLIGLDAVLAGVRPRYRGYADVAELLRRREGS